MGFRFAGEALVVASVLSGIAGHLIAQRKGFNSTIGFLVGFLMPGLGLLIMAAVKDRNVKKGVSRA